MNFTISFRMFFLMTLGLIFFTTPTYARLVTDHTGKVVNVPEHPSRIISLHDWTLTVMSHELGAPLIASTGRISDDGSLFMRGANELFGLNFDQIELASIHGKLDLERIMMLKPDLILANTGDYQAYQEVLSSIAPTLMFNPSKGQPILELYEEFSQWLGRHEKFIELKNHYQSEIQSVNQELIKLHINSNSYIAMLANNRDGTIEILRDYGILTTVMDDLGLHRMPITQSMGKNTSRMIISPELIESIDADYIVTTFLSEQGENEESIKHDLEHIAPGSLSFLKAVEQDQLLSFPRSKVYSPSFYGLTLLLNKIRNGLLNHSSQTLKEGYVPFNCC
ncbi:ABC transporter substrate-binding protein [Vibrio mimicus]